MLYTSWKKALDLYRLSDLSAVPRQTENFIKSWNAEHQASQGSWLKRLGKTGGLGEDEERKHNNDHDNDNDNNKPDYSYTKNLIV